MDAVFKRSGVERAHPHHFRHTLASELLGEGGDIDKVTILADSPTTIRRYYAKWTRSIKSDRTPSSGLFTTQIWHRYKKGWLSVNKKKG